MIKIIICTILLFFNFISFSQESLFKFQNYNTIAEYLQNKQIKFNDDDLFILKDFESFVKYNGEGFLKGPVVHAFNSEGLYLETIEPNEVIEKLSNFNKIQKKPKKNAINIDNWLERFINIKSLKLIEKKNNADFYFVLNWGTFFYNQNNVELIFKWNEVLQRQKQNNSIQTIILDMDLQDTWDLSKEKKENILKQANGNK